MDRGGGLDTRIPAPAMPDTHFKVMLDTHFVEMLAILDARFKE